MDLDSCLTRMSDHAQRIRALAEGVGDEQARWRPDPQSWSVLEVVNHLLDEEREDFRVRLDIILHRPADPWPPIDPAGWVVDREYNQRDLAPSLADFLQERDHSLAWLRGLGRVNLQARGPAPWGGDISAGDMLASWAVHDLLHLRQLAQLHLAYAVEQAHPFHVDYSGI